MDYTELTEDLCCIAVTAGRETLNYYDGSVKVERKEDNSPVTQADYAAHHIIVDALEEMAPAIPIISEESERHELPEGAEYFWLVDPLDGTKSFIRGTGEFTINIGLIHRDTPVMGVIYVPVKRELYWGIVGQGAWRKVDDEEVQMIQTRTPDYDALSVVVSKSHLDPQTEAFLQDKQVADKVSASSSLKFCRVAEGVADLYPRFGPTMEWDTAAGHAIVVAAGGRVETPEGAPFTYGHADFRNSPFIVWGNKAAN